MNILGKNNENGQKPPEKRLSKGASEVFIDTVRPIGYTGAANLQKVVRSVMVPEYFVAPEASSAAPVVTESAEPSEQNLAPRTAEEMARELIQRAFSGPVMERSDG